jgi:TRAP-type C4-dicarboxylate transport system permease small subunit
MSDPLNDPPNERENSRGQIPDWLVVLAGIPLLAAMMIEFVAVIARNSGWPLVGSIELVQAMILLSSSGALVAATLSRSHAKVTVVSRRIHGKSGRALRVLVALGGVVFFLSVAAGSAWIAVDMWHGAERSELLGVPYLPLRCIVVLSTFVIAAIYARRVVTELRRR